MTGVLKGEKLQNGEVKRFKLKLLIMIIVLLKLFSYTDSCTSPKLLITRAVKGTFPWKFIEPAQQLKSLPKAMLPASILT